MPLPRGAKESLRPGEGGTTSTVAAPGSQLRSGAQQVKPYKEASGVTGVSPWSHGPPPLAPSRLPVGHIGSQIHFSRLRVAFLSIVTAVTCFYNCKGGRCKHISFQGCRVGVFFLPPAFFFQCVSNPDAAPNSSSLHLDRQHKAVLSVKQAGLPGAGFLDSSGQNGPSAPLGLEQLLYLSSQRN